MSTRPPSRLIRSRQGQRGSRPSSAVSIKSQHSSHTLPPNHQFPDTPYLVNDNVSTTSDPPSPSEIASPKSNPLLLLSRQSNGGAQSPRIHSIPVQFRVNPNDESVMLGASGQTLKTVSRSNHSVRKRSRRNRLNRTSPLKTPR
ncbi:hypothetical protein GEMRC1_011498 [Eukaryota sp. GEM-RC1]